MNLQGADILGGDGIAILILWFMPFGYIGFMGREMYQTVQHIGGISYLLLVV